MDKYVYVVAALLSMGLRVTNSGKPVLWAPAAFAAFWAFLAGLAWAS